MYYSGDVLKIRVTPENIDQFYYVDDRTEREDYIKDRQALEQKMIAYEKEGRETYPGSYDITVLTYTQYQKPYLINDGCHRMQALKRTLFPKKLIDGFTFWLIPTNILGAETKEDAYKLNKQVDDKLIEAGLPLWVKKFEFCEIDGKLTAWKNINIINTGDTNELLQFGVDWKLNQNMNFAKKHNIEELPKWGDLIKYGSKTRRRDSHN